MLKEPIDIFRSALLNIRVFNSVNSESAIIPADRISSINKLTATAVKCFSTREKDNKPATLQRKSLYTPLPAKNNGYKATNTYLTQIFQKKYGKKQNGERNFFAVLLFKSNYKHFNAFYL